MQKNNQRLKAILSQAFIIGGSPCSGKSTIARKLAAEYQLQYYQVDDYYQAHVKRCNPDRHPTMHKIAHMGWNEIWSRAVPTQVSDELEYYRELFEMILDDLAAFEPGKAIIVEGAALLPELVEKCDVDARKVLYMVPTKAFQIRHYSQREFIHHILKDCDDPEKAFENWMMRDHQFGRLILRQAQTRNYKTILVDGSQDIGELYTQVKNYFGLSSCDFVRFVVNTRFQIMSLYKDIERRFQAQRFSAAPANIFTVSARFGGNLASRQLFKEKNFGSPEADFRPRQSFNLRLY